MSIGSRIRLAREKKGWTQTYVCQKLNIPNSTLSGYERGYRIPDAYMIKSLAEVLEVSPSYLLGYKSNNEQRFIDENSDLETMLSEGRVTYKGVPLTEEQCDFLVDLLEVMIRRRPRHK